LGWSSTPIASSRGLRPRRPRRNVGSLCGCGTPRARHRSLRRTHSLQRGIGLLATLVALGCSSSAPPPKPVERVEPKLAAPPEVKPVEGEVHLADIRQLTYDAGENAEAYWSFDGEELIFQSSRDPYKCDQIMRISASADATTRPTLVSTGKGRTTCAYFMPGKDRVVWSSTHEASAECPTPPDMSQGYVWGLFPTYNIYSSDPNGGDMKKLTDTPTYDAEATVCAKDGSIIFTSTRDGDLDLYRMDADGSNVVRLTHELGYDGGAFFSADCEKIVWRASRPTGKAAADYKRLLKQNMVRPSRLEIFVADADGKNARQVTYLGAASFAPYLHPSGERILFSSNYPDPRGREFDIWAINIDGTGLEQITRAEGFDGFPMFSPDGTRLAFASNRNNAEPRQTDVFVARWVDEGTGKGVALPADRFAADVAYLASDELGGRGVGTPGIRKAADFIVKRFKELGVEGGFSRSKYGQAVRVPTSVSVGGKTSLSITRQRVSSDDFVPASFSSSGEATARTAFVGYGIKAPELGHDDYAKARVEGKIAVVRRFVPDTEAFKKPDNQRRYSDMHYKAFTARENGAVGIIFVDSPEVARGARAPEEAPLPPLSLARLKNVGIPAVVVKRSAGDKLLGDRGFRVSMSVELIQKKVTTYNIAGRIPAGGARRPGAVVVGAHYDHLGMGGESSLEPGVSAPHNGADDNASGVAGLLEVARQLAANRDKLSRDVYLVAFTAEEMGLLGANHFVKNLPKAIKASDIVAMLNMDMIGRLRDNTVAAIGGSTAGEWPELVSGACAEAEIRCRIGGDGYGPSDQTAFYAAGAPVLHFFTGAHPDYHKTSDDAASVNAGGGAQVAAAVSGVARAVANRDASLTFKRVAAPLPAGDRRSWGASLGTIPSYSDSGEIPGMLIDGVRPGGAAEKAGIKGGDRITKIGPTQIRNVQDLVYVLQRAKPGERVTVEYSRAGKTYKTQVTYGESSRRPRK
jgi:Tol biopolymer transport system component